MVLKEPKYRMRAIDIIRSIEDAERRIGSHIVSGGSCRDAYVQSQIEWIERIVRDMKNNRGGGTDE